MEKHSKIMHKKNPTPEQNQRSRRIAWMFYVLFLILVLAFSAMPRETRALETFDDAVMKNVLQPWKGDLDSMIERRVIRVLVTYSKTNFFLNGAAKHGFVYEIFEQFNKFLNNKLKKKGVTKKTSRDKYRIRTGGGTPTASLPGKRPGGHCRCKPNGHHTTPKKSGLYLTLLHQDPRVGSDQPTNQKKRLVRQQRG